MQLEISESNFLDYINSLKGEDLLPNYTSWNKALSDGAVKSELMMAQGRPDPCDCVLAEIIPGRYLTTPVASVTYFPAFAGKIFANVSNKDENGFVVSTSEDTDTTLTYIHSDDPALPDYEGNPEYRQVDFFVNPLPKISEHGGNKGKSIDDMTAQWEAFKSENTDTAHENMFAVAELFKVEDLPESIQSLLTYNETLEEEVRQPWNIGLSLNPDGGFDALMVLTQDKPETSDELRQYANIGDPKVGEELAEVFADKMMKHLMGE